MAATDEIERLVAERGSLHVARIVAYLCRGLDNWHGRQTNTPGELAEPEKSSEKLEGVLQSAFELLAGVITASALHAEDVDRALKSAGLDRDIDKQLHARSTTGSA